MRSKFNTWLRGSRGEQGQAMVMAAFAMVVILGFAAFAVDIGHIAVQKSDLQNAADAAALAGAAEMPSSANAVSTAVDYAKANGMVVTTNNVMLDGEKVYASTIGANQVRVECSREVDYYFAGVFGFESKTVSAVAVAEKNSSNWNGESLPFINLAFDYSTTDPTAWTKVGPGIKGTITDFNTLGTGDDLYFEVAYQDGITVKKGYADGVKGLDASKLADGLATVIKTEDMNIKVVYLFSLRSDVIQKGKFYVYRSGVKKYITLSNLKNDDTILPDQLVLIQCLFVDCKWSNQHDLVLTYLGNVYDLGNSGNNIITGKPLTDLPNFPTDYINTSGGAGIKLTQ